MRARQPEYGKDGLAGERVALLCVDEGELAGAAIEDQRPVGRERGGLAGMERLHGAWAKRSEDQDQGQNGGQQQVAAVGGRVHRVHLPGRRWLVYMRMLGIARLHIACFPFLLDPHPNGNDGCSLRSGHVRTMRPASDWPHHQW